MAVGMHCGSDKELSEVAEEEAVVGDGPDADWEMMKAAWQVLGNMKQTVIGILILNVVDGPGSETESVSVIFDHHVCYIH